MMLANDNEPFRSWRELTRAKAVTWTVIVINDKHNRMFFGHNVQCSYHVFLQTIKVSVFRKCVISPVHLQCAQKKKKKKENKR